MRGADAHKHAAIGYAGLGVMVILITLLAGLVPEGRENAVLELSVGAAFILIFAALIFRGRWPVSAALVFSNSWRAFTYFNDGRGQHVELLPLKVSRIEPQPVAFLNAILMSVIVALLARSAVFGFVGWRARRAA